MADILIKNMEMPKACEYCPIYDEDYCQCRLEHTFEAHWSREKYCPLVELPPHGRLIDADKLFLEAERFDLPNIMPDSLWIHVGDLLRADTIVEASNGSDN